MAEINGKKILGVIIESGSGGGSKVLVNGEEVEVFDADTKLDRWYNDTYNPQLCAIDKKSSKQITFRLSSNTSGEHIPLFKDRYMPTTLYVPTPLYGENAAPKQYVDNSRLYVHTIKFTRNTTEHGKADVVTFKVLSHTPTAYEAIATLIYNNLVTLADPLPCTVQINREGIPLLAQSWVIPSNGTGALQVGAPNSSYGATGKYYQGIIYPYAGGCEYLAGFALNDTDWTMTDVVL